MNHLRIFNFNPAIGIIDGKASSRGEPCALRARRAFTFKGGRLLVIFLALLISNAAGPLPAYASSALPRNVAKRVAADSIASVRRHINTNPAELESYLMDTLAIPIGDDPRVLSVCREVLEKTNSKADRLSVAQALSIIAQDHINFWHARNQKAQIAEMAKMLLAQKDPSLKDYAARILMLLGGKHADEAVPHYVELLSSSAPHGQAEPKARETIYR